MGDAFQKELSRKWFQFILDHPQNEWSWREISRNPNLTWEIVQEHPELPWDYSALTTNSNITWKIIEENSDKPWSVSWLTWNPNITWDNFQTIFENSSELRNLFLRVDFPFGFSHEREIFWEGLSSNPNITWSIVEKNLDKPWSWKGLSQNPNMTWKIIEDNPDKPWDWFWLSRNKMVNLRDEVKRTYFQSFVEEILKKFNLPSDLDQMIIDFI